MSRSRDDKTKQQRYRDKKGTAVYFMLNRHTSKRLEAIRELDNEFTYELFFGPWVRLIHELKTKPELSQLTYDQFAREFAKLGRGLGLYDKAVEDQTASLMALYDEQINLFTDLYGTLRYRWPDEFTLSDEDLKEYTDQVRNTEY